MVDRGEPASPRPLLDTSSVSGTPTAHLAHPIELRRIDVVRFVVKVGGRTCSLNSWLFRVSSGPRIASDVQQHQMRTCCIKLPARSPRRRHMLPIAHENRSQRAQARSRAAELPSASEGTLEGAEHSGILGSGWGLTL